MPKRLTKSNKTNVVSAILVIAKQSTKPILARQMALKLRDYQRNFCYSDTEIYKWMKQLHEQGKLKSVFLEAPDYDDGILEEHFEIV